MTLPYWRLSAFYFCYFATLGSFLPFWSLYLKSQAFSADQIGELSACLLVTKIIAPQLFGWLADRSQLRMPWIRLSCLLSPLIFVGFLYQNQYHWYAIVSLGFSFFWNATLPQFEAATLFHLQNRLSQHYSRIRSWGSIGFIMAVIVVGRVVDYYGPEILPVIILAILVMNLLVALTIPEAGRQPVTDSARGLLEIVFRKHTLAFFVVYLLLQVAHGPYYVFFSVYLKTHHYTATETAWLWALGVAAEIILFMFAGALLKRFSLWALLCTTLVFSAIRWWMIACLVDVSHFLVIAQLLHAASFGLAHVVAIQLLYAYFGHHHQSQGQALYSAISFGVGGMLGSLGSGYFWDKLGGDAVFLLAMCASIGASLIAAVCIPKGVMPTEK